jgi:YidC/Oxa1 family membrane protein insertase
MTDLRRALLWAVFSVSLLMLWDGWNKHQGKPSLFDPAGSASVATAPAAPRVSAELPVPVGTGASQTTASGAAVGAATPAAAPGTTPGGAPAGPSDQVVVNTDVLKATFDTRGATLVRLELLKQHEQSDPAHNIVLMDRSPHRLYLAETGLISPQGGAVLPNHLTNMTLLPGERSLADGQDALALRFESPETGGIKRVLTYTLHRGSYTVDLQQDISNVGSAPVPVQAYLQLVRDGNVETSSMFMGPSSYTGPAVYTEAGKFQKVDFKHIEEHKPDAKPLHELQADNGWVAMVQHYFASAWLLTDKAPREFFTRKVDNNLYAVGMIVPLGEVAPGASKTVKSELFAGPQEENKLETLAPGLELVKDYGWLTLLAKPLFWLLSKLHGLIGNWGWSIVALVVILKAAFFYLNASAYRSMAKMKAINPKVVEMRERLKDKPQQMQQEMMRIYREEKVNPIGGCLPIFIQMPFFIALYWVLLSSVEMRNAPWIGWITDLSAKDPFYILPLVMTGSTLLQTWLNPTPPDPIQARMMWIMPLAFSVMFFVFPAGLVLYWVTNNILSIAQQYVINKQLGVTR